MCWSPPISPLPATSSLISLHVGDRLDEFDKTARARLAEFSDADTFIEDNEFLIRIGRRS